MQEKAWAVAKDGVVYLTPWYGGPVFMIGTDPTTGEVNGLLTLASVPRDVPQVNVWCCAWQTGRNHPKADTAAAVRPVLEEALEAVTGPRAADYGDPKVNMARWRDMVRAAGMDLTAEQLVRVMILLKISRDIHKAKRDNAVDIAGYAELLELARGL